MALTDVFLQFVLPIATIIAGGGWFVTYKAYKRKNEGEATQAEAEGWKAQQDVYQQTIEDLKESCAYIKEDRNLLREENRKLRDENDQLRDKYKELEQQILALRKEHEDEIGELRKEMARMGRRLEVVLPFSCAVVNCSNRKRVEIQDQQNQVVIED